jgi:hypothetical protein
VILVHIYSLTCNIYISFVCNKVSSKPDLIFNSFHVPVTLVLCITLPQSQIQLY